MSTINPTFTDRYRDAVVDLISGSITANPLNLSGNLVVAGDTEIQGNAMIDDIVSLSGKVRWDNGTSDGLSGTNSVAIGTDAGNETQNSGAVAIGFRAGKINQGSSAVSIGNLTGSSDQGTNAVAVGSEAGKTTQGNSTVAIGQTAGWQNQGTSAVALGYKSGYTSQSSGAVSVGAESGSTSQGNSAVAIGNNAGKTSQGASSIAIGKQAGETNQHDNSIVLNASGVALNTNGTSRCFISPVRTAASSSDIHPLQYNTTTKEVSYATNGIPVFVGEGAQLTNAALEVTGIPTWCKNVQVIFRNIVWSNANIPALFLGYGSGPTYNNTTYNGLITSIDSTGAVNRAGTGTGVNLQQTSLTTGSYSGIFNLSRAGVYSTFEQWIWSFQSFNENGPTDYFINGAGTFTAPNTEIINSVKINTTAGTFTAGSMIVYAW